MIRGLLPLLALAGCTAAFGGGALPGLPEAYRGLWASDVAAQCPNAALAGRSEAAPVSITATSMSGPAITGPQTAKPQTAGQISAGPETACTVAEARRGGEGVVIANLVCGADRAEIVTATLYRSGRSLTFNRGAGSLVWTKCPPAS